MTMERVLVGFDGSVPAVRALDLAAEEAALRGGELEIVHALPDVDGAAPVLAAAVDRVHTRHPALETAAVPVAGDPVRALLDRGRTAALTVVGSRDLDGIAGFVTGSVSRRTAARAECPVMIVGGKRAGRRQAGPGFVLFVVGADDEADAAGLAFAEARLRGVELRIRHAPTYAPAAPGPAAARRHPAAPEPHQRAPQHRETRAALATSAAGAAETGEALLVVATRRSCRGPDRAARSLLHEARCPVVLVPAR
ncbi:hypothetical protein AA958_29125 [Streptomyces sp. CNQ-509]|uniref:universal stress protein n=1 Tax=Streptomyces sp. CNQ-509 TaxID=444103 RepID=UPI00062DE26B|nr:universal stress protein [Streptomyces sp. CNQ-509]AKH85633.1 hypothetical protein AA958_29125 [Streptomyces sp. CNQ-509]